MLAHKWVFGKIISDFNVNTKHNFWIYILVFHDMRFCQIIWQIFTYRRAKKIHQKLPPVGIEPLNHHANAPPIELIQHSVGSLNLHGIYKVMLYWF